MLHLTSRGINNLIGFCFCAFGRDQDHVTHDSCHDHYHPGLLSNHAININISTGLYTRYCYFIYHFTNTNTNTKL